ncbi:ATP-binding cassette domain-containing protein [Chitinophaga silvatica]|uniref:ATP-binding cassette domain-containing protein n=1 Tax=Chitinophaga silvatica TaxID=2282649 RepID=A0A3E1YHP7_9BACT|nr:ATP-binding cassette domain-containing protein [Chitinophaga silvatica]RFS26975.1 ATP-binding cassette domain-containing protein [Chitinophaga silvatica]
MVHQLVADGIVKSWDLRQLLTDCYMTCSTGEIVGLLGRNGCGKSTMLQIVFGTLESEQCRVKVDGQLYRKPYKARDLIAYLPQGNFVPRHLKVADLVKLFPVSAVNAAKFLSNPRISQIQDLRISELSGGQERFVEIMLILHSSAKFILLDEPFNALDPIIKEEVIAIIRSHTHQGIILTDHDYTNVLAVSTRIMLLNEGALKQIQDLKELEWYKYLPENTILG